MTASANVWRTGRSPSAVRGWLQRVRRRLRQLRGLEPRVRVQIRCEQHEHGGWWICPEAIREGDVAYSFSMGGDFELETALAGSYGAKVFAFDPDPTVVERVAAGEKPAGVRYEPLAIGGRDGRVTVETPGGASEGRMLRLPSVLRMLGHRRVDLIKLQAGAGTFDAITDLLGLDVDVRQVLVRFDDHDGPASPSVWAAIRGLGEHGYRIFHMSDDGRQYSFMRTDFGAG